MNLPANLLPQPLRRVAGRVLESALNRALALDPDTRAALPALSGRSVDLVLQSPPVALSIRVDGQALRVGPPSPVAARELGVSATLGAVLAQLSPWRDEQAAPVGQLSISGDADLARRVQRLAQRFDPDWDAALARVFGEVAGHQLGKALRGGMGWARESAAALARDGADWLTEEAREVIGAAELAAFLDEVDQLRDDVERLQVRVQRSAARIRR